MRRCHDDRWDFTAEDANVFPMYVHKGGGLYGFCPAKSTWDAEVVGLFQMLLVSAETGVQWNAGGLSDQPPEWIDLLAWFLQRYDAEKFASRARMVLGDGKAAKATAGGKRGSQPGTAHGAGGAR